MKYEILIQATSQGTVTIEAMSPQDAKEQATRAFFTGDIHWEGTKLDFPSVVSLEK